jgi:quercetin dioxygenase-like cupin family protein
MADSGYTLTNLEEADDVVGPRTDGRVQGRFLRPVLDSRELGVSRFTFSPGFRSSAGHHHETQEEVYVVVGGSGRAKVDDDVMDLKAWDVLRVAPESIRAFEAGPDGLDLVIVGGTRPEEGDGHMVPDWWTGWPDV